jgi:creatinine amidohydrolase
MRPFNERDYKDYSWREKTWTDIQKCVEEQRIVVLPLGSIEQHGPMLPVGCDWFLAETRSLQGVKRAYEKYQVKALVLPTIPYGIAPHHTDFPGTITLEIKTYLLLLENLIKEVVRTGFKTIVCISGHGGNIIPAKTALVNLKHYFHQQGITDIHMYFADSENCFTEDKKMVEDFGQKQFDFHASAVETSYYLYHRPELVDKKGMVKPRLKKQSMPADFSWRTKDISETGASGDPSKATSEKGKEIYKYTAEAFAEFLKRVSNGVI